MKALILAAGYGSRLYPLTKNISKPLLPIGGKPIISYIVEKLQSLSTIDEIIIVTNEQFAPHFKKWSLKIPKKNIPLVILSDGTEDINERLGAMGDIDFIVRKRDIKDAILIIGGDNLFDWELDKFVTFSLGKSPSVSIGLYDIKDRELARFYGVVEMDRDKRIIDFEEKPQKPFSSLIAMCLYYFPKESLKGILAYINHRKTKKDATGEYINWLSQREPVYGFVSKGNWFDIGHIDSYRKAQEVFGNNSHLKKKRSKR